MATVASAPRARRAPAQPAAPAPPVRHGTCGLILTIGGTRYQLRPITPPAGFKIVWSLHKRADHAEAIYQVAVEKGQPPACTCPDCETRGSVCKHIGALKALGLIPGRKARPAAARRAHARRLAEGSAPVDPPAEIPARPAGSFATGFRSAVASEIRRIAGADGPEAEADGHLCVWCGQPFEPEISRDPHLCAACNEYGNAQGVDQ